MALLDGIVGCWSPSLGATGYTLLDRTRNASHGTLTNMASSDWMASQLGTVLNFDATDNVVPIAGSRLYIRSGTPMLASVWFYNRSFVSQYPKLLMLKSDDTSAWELGYSNNVGSYDGILIGTSSSYARLRTTTSPSALTGSWNHVCVLYNGGTTSTAANYACVLNGKLVAFTSASGFAATTNATSIGYNVVNNRHDGLIGEIGVWNRAASVAEAAELFRLGNGWIGRELTGMNRRRRFGRAATGVRRRRILTGIN